MTKFLAFSSAILLGLITVFGDYLIKKGSLKISFSGWQYLLAGCIIYGLTGVGWFFVFRIIEISDVGAIYSMTCIVALAMLGVIVFHERLSPGEILGIVFAIASVILLYRFS